MLILTRRVGESLMVGDEITVTVLGVKGNQVRIGVNAPKDTIVDREEVYYRRKEGKPKKTNTAAQANGTHQEHQTGGRHASVHRGKAQSR